MGFSVMLWSAEKLVPVEYWCPYGMFIFLQLFYKIIQFVSSHLNFVGKSYSEEVLWSYHVTWPRWDCVHVALAESVGDQRSGRAAAWRLLFHSGKLCKGSEGMFSMKALFIRPNLLLLLYWRNPPYPKNTPYPRSYFYFYYCAIFVRNCAVVIRNLHKVI